MKTSHDCPNFAAPDASSLPAVPPARQRPIRLYGLIAIWLVLLAIGYGASLAFDARPGDPASADSRWPTAVPLERMAGGATLVMFVHPECPCSGASLTELDQLTQEVKKPFKLYVVVVDPDGQPGGEPSSNEQRAAQISRAQILRDQDGSLAHRFGVTTSGDLLIYDAEGRLIFSGGVTVARGHLGKGRSTTDALQLLDAESSDEAAKAPHRHPVFGCPLF